MNKRALLFKISQVLEQYGTPVEVIRDVYTVDENTGLRELKQEDAVVEEYMGVIDNSKTNAIKTANNDRGSVQRTYTSDLYIAWTEDFIIEIGDTIICDNVKYKVKAMDDLVHYNLCYHLVIEKVI